MDVGVRRRSRSRRGRPASATGRSRPRAGSVPWSSRKRSAGASVASSIDGVRPSITIRTTGLAAGPSHVRGCEARRSRSGVSAAQPQPERGQRDRLEVADHGHEGERGGEQRREPDEQREAAAGAASPERAGDDGRPPNAPASPPRGPPTASYQLEDDEADRRTGHRRRARPRRSSAERCRRQDAEGHADADDTPIQYQAPIPVSVPRASSPFGRRPLATPARRGRLARTRTPPR